MLESSLLKITELLKQNAILYMVIGGYAVVYHGESRFTEDIDITLGVDTDHLDILLTILKDEFSVRVESPVDFVEKTNVLPVRDNQNSVRIDLLFSFIDFEREAIKRAETVAIDDRSVQIVSAADLIIYKLIAGRARDIEDAKSVLERKAGTLDIKFIDKHLSEMSDLIGHRDLYKTWEVLKNQVL